MQPLLQPSRSMCELVSHNHELGAVLPLDQPRFRVVGALAKVHRVHPLGLRCGRTCRLLCYVKWQGISGESKTDTNE
jgi:hypothetical protein